MMKSLKYVFKREDVMKAYAIIAAFIFTVWSVPISAAGSIEVHACNTPVRSVLEGLARASGINLIIDDTVQGNMTMHLSGVTAEEAIDAITASQNLFYEKNNSIRTITAGGRSDNGVKAVHSWHLQHTNPQSMRKL